MMKNQPQKNTISISKIIPGWRFTRWKYHTILEKAKRLSVNSHYLDSISEFRRKWGISTWSGSDLQKGPAVILYECTRHLSYSDNNLLEIDIEALADKYYLDIKLDYGLIILSICIGLTPELIINHWMDYYLIVTAAGEYHSKIIVDLPQDFNDLEANYVEAILFLIQELKHYDRGYEIPNYIENMLKDAELILNNKSDIGIVENRSKRKAISDHSLYIEIGPYTRLDHIGMLWPLVENEQIWLWDVQKQDYRIWRHFERDVFIWQKVRIEHTTYEEAYNDHWLAEHPDEGHVNISVIKKAVRKIDKINE